MMASTSDLRDVESAARAMVDSVNRGDFGDALGSFGPTPTIVEDIAPFRWQGPDAPASWLAAMGENAAALGVRTITLLLLETTRIDVAGPFAYAVFRGMLTLTLPDGDLCSEGILTLTLQQDDDRWLIDTLVWSGPEPTRT